MLPPGFYTKSSWWLHISLRTREATPDRIFLFISRLDYLRPSCRWCRWWISFMHPSPPTRIEDVTRPVPAGRRDASLISHIDSLSNVFQFLVLHACHSHVQDAAVPCC